MSDVRTLTRNQLANVCNNDHEAIRAFEALFLKVISLSSSPGVVGALLDSQSNPPDTDAAYNFGTVLLRWAQIWLSGSVNLRADNASLFLGAGGDASIYYDGSDLIIDPKLVGSGVVSVSGALTVTDEVYGVGWNASVEVPTKNAVYDKIETLTGGSPGGSDTQIQYNNAGAFGGIASLVYDGVDVKVLSDTVKLLFGAGGDASILYNGTDLLINPKIVGTGVVAVSGALTVTDEVYGVGWNASVEVPTKNAVYDKIESLSGGAPGGSDTEIQYNNAGAFGGITNLTFDGTDINVAADNQKLTFGAAGSVDSYLEFDGTYLHLSAQSYIRLSAYLLTDFVLGTSLNTFLGVDCGQNLTHGSGIEGWYNTLFGFQCAEATTTGSYNTVIGTQALKFNTTGSGNTVIGAISMTGNIGGSNNTAVGFNVLNANIGGTGNTAFGVSALAQNVSGIDNVAVGNNSATVNTGSHNVALGTQALYLKAAGDFNVAIGREAIRTAGTKSGNIGIGKFAGYALTTGGWNTIVGYQAGTSMTSGHYNITLGAFTQPTSTTASYQITIGTALRGDWTPGSEYLWLPVDSQELYFGAAKDASILYDGTDLVVKSDAVGTGTVKTDSGRKLKTTRKTTTYTTTTQDDVLFSNTDAGAWTLTLVAGTEGLRHRIVNSGSSDNLLTITPNGSEHLLGANDSFYLFDGEALEIEYNATDGWY